MIKKNFNTKVSIDVKLIVPFLKNKATRSLSISSARPTIKVESVNSERRRAKVHNETRILFGIKSNGNVLIAMVDHGMLSSAGNLVYLTMNTGKWPSVPNWAHEQGRVWQRLSCKDRYQIKVSWTDGRTNGWADTATCRVACLRLITEYLENDFQLTTTTKINNFP